MVRQIIDALRPCPGKLVLDLTEGGGGHTRAFLERGASVVGLDRDREALEMAGRVVAEFGNRVALIHGRMSQARELLAARGIERVQGCILDAGISMDQLVNEARGFSAHSSQSLDARMDRTEPGSLTGEDVINGYLDKDLHRVFTPIGRRREARAVVRAILSARARQRIETAAQLADIIAATITRGGRGRRIDAAPYLMCVRAEVNSEDEELRAGIEAGVDLLTPDGESAICVLSWNSNEHRIAKQTLRRLQDPCVCDPALPICSCGRKPLVRFITPKPLSPEQDEVQANPAARSARLSIAVRLAEQAA